MNKLIVILFTFTICGCSTVRNTTWDCQTVDVVECKEEPDNGDYPMFVDSDVFGCSLAWSHNKTICISNSGGKFINERYGGDLP